MVVNILWFYLWCALSRQFFLQIHVLKVENDGVMFLLLQRFTFDHPNNLSKLTCVCRVGFVFFVLALALLFFSHPIYVTAGRWFLWIFLDFMSAQWIFTLPTTKVNEIFISQGNRVLAWGNLTFWLQITSTAVDVWIWFVSNLHYLDYIIIWNFRWEFDKYAKCQNKNVNAWIKTFQNVSYFFFYKISGFYLRELYCSTRMKEIFYGFYKFKMGFNDFFPCVVICFVFDVRNQ